MNITEEERFKEILQALPTTRTSYGSTLELYNRSLERKVLKKCKKEILFAFGLPLSDFEEEITATVRKKILDGLCAYKKSRYYFKQSAFGRNMMELRPWSSCFDGKEDFDFPNYKKYGVIIAHVPHKLYENLEGYKHLVLLSSAQKYYFLMQQAVDAEMYEIKPLQVISVTVTNQFLDKTLNTILTREWKLIADNPQETPQQYQQLLDRIDATFRFTSQQLYAQRENNGICIAVLRPHSDRKHHSFVVSYIPDAFRFTAEQMLEPTGLAGILYHSYGTGENAQYFEKLIVEIKREL
ncbi:hypothetical protein HZA96_03410 [Candidatus Woesearchaeota archaeon]|nr:hypothetical protein [Candidatus Woesearchaeota archaeon]